MGNHQHNNSLQGKKLFLSIILNLAITIAQIIGGLISNSLSLLTDALHNFSDVISLIISWFAHKLSHKPADNKRTFGYKRAEIMAAFINAASLLAVSFFLIKEAIERFNNPVSVQTSWVIGLGMLSIIINGISVLLLSKDAKTSLNIRSAYLHLFTDMLTSIVVVLGGIIMSFWPLYWIDPLLTVIIAVYLIVNSWKILSDALKILMLFAPAELNTELIKIEVLKFSKIQNIHHIHLWALNDTQTHLEAHLSFSNNLSLAETNIICSTVEEMLKKQFSIQHITFQAEFKPDCKEN
ncbi:MAG: cation diffusion facilitator family transporter [Bacteroidales bacterium]|jgi:cobalt-zinc-cadmium efflux system protein|nr:cation diffusion facilitator family transporter [Bacteroidales bacterium]